VFREQSLAASDIVVIGGGPAGSATAIICARAGLRVTLVERSAFPRQVPGDTLHPGVLPLLRTLGVENQVLAAGFVRHEGHCVKWDGPPRFVPFGSDSKGLWRGLQAWRPRFDAILLERVRQLGVCIEQPSQPRLLRRGWGKVIGIVTDQGPLDANFVVDATGTRGWLTQQLGLKMECVSPRLTACYGYATGSCPERDAVPALSADAAGWTWVARVRSQIYQWTRLNFDGQRPDPDWLPAELAKLKACQPTRGADVTWRIASSPAGPGYFLVGDAAAALDPCSSHGVLRALMSGMYAGHLIVQVLAHGQPAMLAIEAYSTWLRDWFNHEAQKLTELYSVLVHPPLWAAVRPGPK
jgi:flavin-dependent dehydrogenase